MCHSAILQIVMVHQREPYSLVIGQPGCHALGSVAIVPPDGPSDFSHTHPLLTIQLGRVQFVQQAENGSTSRPQLSIGPLPHLKIVVPQLLDQSLDFLQSGRHFPRLDTGQRLHDRVRFAP